MVASILDRFRDQISRFRPGEAGNSKKLDPFQPDDRKGLYHYDVGENGSRKRVHLRFAADGNAVMFVDVTDVIHLNQSAAEITWLALENVPIDVARKGLSKRYRAADRSQLSEDITRLFDMVNALESQEAFCPSCSITDIDQAPIFSLPAAAPYKVDLALTYGCNNHCTHCYNEPERYPMPSMSKAMWKEVIDKLHQVGVPHLIFTGGEATLHPDLPELIKYGESKGMITGLNTNGRRLSHLPYARELVSAGLNHVQITLASHQAEDHDQTMGARAFAQTIQGIRYALDSGIHVITNTTLTRRNSHDVVAILDFLQNLGIQTFAMNGMIHSGGGQSNPDAILPEKMKPILTRVRDESRARNMRFLWYTPTDYCSLSPIELDIGAKRCNAGEYSICIEPNGDVLPCQSYYIAAGNILSDPWEKIWQSDLFLSFRQREIHPESAGLPEKCWKCPEISLCGGGCRIEHMASSEKNLFGLSTSTIALQQVGTPTAVDISATYSFIPEASTASTRSRGSGVMSPQDSEEPSELQGINRR
jgi:radical SAM protein with 4Fe4S-binding SPASM domain